MNYKLNKNIPEVGEVRETVWNGTKTITKRLDENCPWCGSPVLFKQIHKAGEKKPNVPFLGCSNYPHCDWTDYKEPI